MGSKFNLRARAKREGDAKGKGDAEGEGGKEEIGKRRMEKLRTSAPVRGSCFSTVHRKYHE